MALKQVLVQMTPELHRALERARQGKPRGPYIERLLWRLSAVKKAAEAEGVVDPKRPESSRGGDRRSEDFQAAAE